MKIFDVIIIGAGPAGSVAAAYLNQQGYTTLVIEKQEFPRFVIGESLLPHCMNDLYEVGLVDVISKLNFQKKTGAIFCKGSAKCEFTFDEQYAESWDWTWQVKRAEFDQALIEEVSKRGVEVLFNTTVKNVTFTEDIHTVEYSNQQDDVLTARCKFVIDASGYGRVLPKLLDLNKPSTSIPRGAIFAHLNDVNRTEKNSNNIFVHAFNNNDAWVWAIPFSDGHTSVGVVGNNDLITEFEENNGEKFKSFISSFEDLHGRFKNAELIFEPKSILGYSVDVKQMSGKGYVLCGNSTEFLDPIFSSGVTLATFSGLKAAKLTHQHLQGEKVDWLSDYENVLKEGIDVFRSYIEAWYNGNLQTILFSTVIDPQIKNQICSVLAGHVWDKKNPFVTKHKTILTTLAKVIKIREAN